MTHASRKAICFAACASTLLLGLALTSLGWCQPPKRSAEELIRFLTHQSPGQTQPPVEAMDCGGTQEEWDDSEAEEALVGLGAGAVPALEAAFDSIEALGQKSPFAFHDSQLMNAYARIKGRAASHRLLRILNTIRPEAVQFRGGS